MIPPNLTDIATIKAILAKQDVFAKRSLGQNFLISPEVVEATLAIAVDGPRNITELGAGLGTVTQALVVSGFAVRAIEKDDVLVELARRHAPGAEVIHGDLKDIDWGWPNTPPDKGGEEGWQLVGNIPYNLTGLIIRRLTQLMPAPAQALLLVQAEVADRILAKPPHMGLMGLAVQLWGQAHHVLSVPRSCFWPQPKVDSALLLLVPNSSPINKEEREGIIALAKTCFQGKRKQIAGSLKRLHFPNKEGWSEKVDTALAVSGIKPTARPQEITSSAWRALWRALDQQA